jgi:uncharacterized membrane protein
MARRVLLAGETFVITQTVTIGQDRGGSATYANGARAFLDALSAGGFDVTHLPSELCESEFPRSRAALNAYDAVVLSDIGALTLLFTPRTRSGHPDVNRLVLLADWVKDEGRGLLMAGGYLSYQGMDGMARYHGTPLEECLPVRCLPHSDGLEIPEGLAPRIVADHPALGGLTGDLPLILGLNRLVPRGGADGTVLAEADYRGCRYPLLAVRQFGKGRTAAWATDIGPHWMSQDFMASSAYPALMAGILGWLCDLQVL